MTEVIEPGVLNTDAAFAQTCRVCRQDLRAPNGTFPYRGRIVRYRDSDSAIVNHPVQAPPRQDIAPLFTKLVVGTRIAQRVLVIDRTVSAVPPYCFDAFHAPEPEGKNT